MFDSIIIELGKGKYSARSVEIYLGDCLEFLKKMPDNSVDITITSPPYNIGKEYETDLPTNKYVEWLQLWINEVYRVTKKEGCFFLNLGYVSLSGRAKAIPIIYLLWDKVPFFLMQEIVWHYGAGVAGKKFLSPRNEKFLWYVKDPNNYTFNLDAIRDPNVKYPNQKKNGKLKCNQLGKNPTDVWSIPKVTSGKNRSSKERTKHPAQFPLAMIERIVKGFSNVGDTVIDPFMGSGTVAEACLKLDRKVIGFEINEKYVEIAAARIEKYAHA